MQTATNTALPSKATPFDRTDSTFGRLSDLATRSEALADSLCGPSPRIAAAAQGELPVTGLLPVLDSMAAKGAADIDRIHDALDRISSYLP